MLVSMLDQKINKNEELCFHMEQKMQDYTDLYEKASKGELWEKINVLFDEKSKNWVEQIQNLLNREEYKIEKSVNEKILILEKFCNLHNKENENALFYKVSSLDEMIRVYQKTVFYIKRVEFNKEENGESIINLMKKWNFTEEYLVAVLEEIVVHNKINTFLNFVRILKEHGYSDLGDYIFRRIESYAEL